MHLNHDFWTTHCSSLRRHAKHPSCKCQPSCWSHSHSQACTQPHNSGHAAPRQACSLYNRCWKWRVWGWCNSWGLTGTATQHVVSTEFAAQRVTAATFSLIWCQDSSGALSCNIVVVPIQGGWMMQQRLGAGMNDARWHACLIIKLRTTSNA